MEPNRIFDKILDITPFACVLMADTYKIQYINPIMSDFLARPFKLDLEGSSILGYIPEEDHQSFIDFIDRLNQPMREQQWQVFRFIGANGMNKNILINGTHNIQELCSEGSYFLVGMPLIEEHLAEILPDIIGQNLLDKFSFNKYESVFDNEIIGIGILDENGYFDEINQMMAGHLDLLRDWITGKNYKDVFSKNVISIIDDLIKIVNEGKRKYEKDIINLVGDTSHRILEITVAKIHVKYEGKDKLMLITEDITEEQKSHTALLMSEKLALTGRLAASLAHEINNPLQTSIGCLGLAEEMLNEDAEEVRTYITMAIEELKRSARIVQKLRDLNRKPEETEKQPVDIDQVIRNVLLLTKNQLYDRGIVPLYINQEAPKNILGSGDQIQQVILNLIMNAIDAMPEGGNIYMDLVNTTDPVGIKVSVRDTGKGISDEIMNHLFDPFFTTKDSGLGLGLFICKQIIDDHNGYLEVESQVGEGTEFTLWLPQTDHAKAEE